MIVDIGHIALQVPDLDAAVEFSTEFLGMHEVERADGTSYLTLASPYPSIGGVCPHHVLQLVEGPTVALDHVALLARGRDGVESVRRRAESAGATVVADPPAEPGPRDALRLVAPSGHLFEVYAGMELVDCPYTPRGLPPHRLGHATLSTADVADLTGFIVDGLGFRLSDWIVTPEGPTVSFTRCHFDHHTLGALGGPAEGLHHIAFEVPSLVEVGHFGDLLARSGRSCSWGPVRHGAGDNIAVYFEGPGGVIVEIYADMHQIVGDDWQPRTWEIDDPRSLNYWAPPAGFEYVLAAHTPLAPAADPILPASSPRLPTMAAE